MKRYRIGEFAKQMGVSLDFIKYYEEAGVIRSVQDPHNRYHYYDFSQSKLVMLIQYFRSFGYSAQEIVTLLRHADEDEVIRLFTAKTAMHRQQALTSNHIIRQLEFMMHAIRCEPNGTWYIVKHPAVYFLPHTNGEDYMSDEKTINSLKAWKEAVPFVYGVDRCIIKADDEEPLFQHGRAILEEDARELSIPLDAPAVYLPETRCLEYYLDVEHSDSFDASPSLSVSILAPIFRVIKEKHFSIAGDLFIRFLAFHYRDGKQYEKNVVYIPVQ